MPKRRANARRPSPFVLARARGVYRRGGCLRWWCGGLRLALRRPPLLRTVGALDLFGALGFSLTRPVPGGAPPNKPLNRPSSTDQGTSRCLRVMVTITARPCLR